MVIIVTVIRRVVDEPATVDQVQFWGPNVVGIATSCRRAPDTNAGILADTDNSARAANVDMPLVAGLRVIIVATVENHPRVGRVRWQYRIDNFAFVARLNFSKRSATSRARFVEELSPKGLCRCILRRLIFVSWFV